MYKVLMFDVTTEMRAIRQLVAIHLVEVFTTHMYNNCSESFFFVIIVIHGACAFVHIYFKMRSVSQETCKLVGMGSILCRREIVLLVLFKIKGQKEMQFDLSDFGSCSGGYVKTSTKCNGCANL